MDRLDRLGPVLFDLWLPRGPEVSWQIAALRGSEALSAPYEFELELRCDEPALDPEALVGADCELLLDRDGLTRTFYGLLAEVEIDLAREREGELPGSRLRARVLPAFALLDQQVDTRFFAGLSVPEILRELLVPALAAYERDIDLEGSLTHDYPRRDYCVQFRESIFDFCSRLLEQEGVAYRFVPDHEAQRERMVLVDHNQAYAEVELTAPGPLAIVRDRSEELERESIQAFEWSSRRRPNRVIARGYDMKGPAVEEREAEEPDDRRPIVRAQIHEGEPRQIIDDPVDDPESRSFDGAALDQRGAEAARRLERFCLERALGRGRSNAVGFGVGAVFELADASAGELVGGPLLLTRVEHGGSVEEGPSSTQRSYHNRFECVPRSRPFRPARRTPRPRIGGVQTGVVVGPSPDEVHTDRFGRVKVKLHVDRHGDEGEHSSCWIRVAQSWAGPGYGAVIIPRVGMEVVLAFVDGDPDRPLVTGCVYNGANAPPYELPEELSKTSFKTASTPGGEGFNELRIEDAAGREQIFVHAQRRMDLRVRGSLYETSFGNYEQVVGSEDSAGARGDAFIHIHGDRNFLVGDCSYEKIDGAQLETVDGYYAGDFGDGHFMFVDEVSQLSAPKVVVEASELISHKAGRVLVGASDRFDVEAGNKLVLEGHTSIELKVGHSFISIRPEGVDIGGLKIRLNSGGGADGAVSAEHAVWKGTFEPFEAREASTGRGGGGGGGGGGGAIGTRGSGVHPNRTLHPHKAPAMPATRNPSPPDKARADANVLSLEWAEQEAWCSERVHLCGRAQGYDGDHWMTARVSNSGDGQTQTAIAVHPGKTDGDDRYREGLEIVDLLPRRGAEGYEEARELDATIDGLKTPTPLRMRFLPGVPNFRVDQYHAHFNISAEDYQVVISEVIEFTRGWMHYIISLGDEVPAETGGIIGGRYYGSSDWRYCKRGPNDEFLYWNGASWAAVPKDWGDELGTKRYGVAVWREGGDVETQYGKLPWPDPVPEWGQTERGQLDVYLSEQTAAIEESWTGNFDLERLECRSEEPRCCRYSVRCKVHFREASTYQQQGIILAANSSRANAGVWSIHAKEKTLAHEFGHHLGNPDEYEGATSVDPTVNGDGAKAGIDDKSIMGVGKIVKRRHYNGVCWALAKAVQEATGKSYTYVPVPVIRS